MFRTELPRIYELHDLVPSPESAGAYFRNLDESLSENPQKLRQYRELEQDLAGLDPTAWAFLKSEVRPLLLARDEKRGWQPLFDKLNQAKAYNYLKRAGYAAVRFIPATSERMTPDLEAYQGQRRAVCEVKTINVSDDEANRRFSGGVLTVTDRLEAGFFRKLRSDFVRAAAQLAAFDAGRGDKMLVYVIINFDDSLHEYADRYGEQIERHLVDQPVHDLEIAFDWRPPFWNAAG